MISPSLSAKANSVIHTIFVGASSAQTVEATMLEKSFV